MALSLDVILQSAFQVPNDLYKAAILPKLRNQQNKILVKKEEDLIVHLKKK